jgi:hypothetical protein
MMRPGPCIAFFLAGCLAAPLGARAADAAQPAVLGSLELKDGRVLHNVRIMSDEPDGIVVRADEGLVKIPRSDLPQAVAGTFPAKAAEPQGPELVMQRFDPNQIVEAPRDDAPKPAPKPVQRPTQVPAPGHSPVYKGCSIISFQLKAFQTLQGCAEVVIHNDTDATVELRPGDFVCVTAAGARLGGRNMITDAFPPAIKRREFIPPRGDVDDIVTFTNDALDIVAVQWAR